MLSPNTWDLLHHFTALKWKPWINSELELDFRKMPEYLVRDSKRDWEWFKSDKEVGDMTIFKQVDFFNSFFFYFYFLFYLHFKDNNFIFL